MMVGLSTIILSLLGAAVVGKDPSCSMFKKEVCSQGNSTVLLVDIGISSITECQSSCLSRSSCTVFTFIPGDIRNRSCILYQSCHLPLSPCHNCVTGPSSPGVGHCGEGLALGHQGPGDLEERGEQTTNHTGYIHENDWVVFLDDF